MCVIILVPVCICICACNCTCVWMGVFMWRTEDNLKCLSSGAMQFFLWDELSVDCNSTSSWVGQEAHGIYTPPPSWCWYYRLQVLIWTILPSFFLTQMLTLAWWALNQQSHLPIQVCAFIVSHVMSVPAFNWVRTIYIKCAMNIQDTLVHYNC